VIKEKLIAATKRRDWYTVTCDGNPFNVEKGLVGNDNLSAFAESLKEVSQAILSQVNPRLPIPHESQIEVGESCIFLLFLPGLGFFVTRTSLHDQIAENAPCCQA
jgi:hypothetical protein